MNDLISIIVPIYNVELYLEKCIDSIIKQTYKNIEIILVDDGSLDKCPQICDTYSLSDIRIIVIHKKNGGLSDARNIGLKHATGKYVLFIDSDDFLDTEMIEKMYNLIVCKNADMAICNFEYYYEYENIKNKVSIDIGEETFSRKEIYEKLFEPDNVSYIIAWNKLYKKNIFKDIKYPVGYINEDEAVIHRIYHKCNKVVTTNEKLYYYRQTPNSIMNSEFNEKRLDKYTAFADRICFSKNKTSRENIEQLLYRYWYNYFNEYYLIYEANNKSKYLKRMKLSLIKIYCYLIKCSFITFKDSIGILIFILSSKIYKNRFYGKQNKELI